jgi:hypothetical protein
MLLPRGGGRSPAIAIARHASNAPQQESIRRPDEI